MFWSWKLTDEQRGGLTSRQSIRYGLLRLQLNDVLAACRRKNNRTQIYRINTDFLMIFA